MEFIDKNLINIDVDLIRDLKRSGKTIEAYEILRNYRQEGKINLKRLKSEELRKARCIKLFKGLCSVENCFNSLYLKNGINNKCFCEYHYIKQKKYRVNNNLKNKK